MGLGYQLQDSFVLIGGKVGTTRTSSALLSTYASTATFDTGSASKVNLSFLYSQGTDEGANSIEIKVESSPDRTNFYRIPNESVSGGTSTLTVREFTLVAPNTSAAAVSFSLPLDIQDEYMRVAVKETGVAVNAGTVYLEATLSGDK